MPSITRRSIAWLLGAVVTVALLVVGYVFRDRLRPESEDHAAMKTEVPPSAAMTVHGASAAGEVARADVFIDPQRQQLIGVRLATVTHDAIAGVVRTTGVVRYDETRLTDVNVKLEGWIRDLRVDYTGQLVRRGQPLFTLYSPDLLTTQNEYLLALKSRDQMQSSQVADAREYANRLVEASRQRLSLWDLSPEQLAELERTRQPVEAVTFTSPASGFVLEKTAIQGMHVTPGQTLYKLADLASVWVEADIYEQDIARLRTGQRAIVTLDAYPGESFTGRAIYIYPFVEENTRTVKVRFQFANARGRLKPGMYANVEIQGGSDMRLTVPADAVLDSGRQQVVFVARGDGMFTPRTVKAGRRFPDRIEILDGVKEGEQVATGATFFLDSESQLRAGLQNYEAPLTTPGSPAPPATALDISFRTLDPPKAGDNTFEVAIRDQAGQPVADADVAVTLFMPAMPTMNMPAMRNQTKLPHAGGGVYRGPGQVLAAGRWDATVTVNRGSQRLGSRQLSLVAR
jgi:Cu(I)/Ag(I) efflux system membrane fusion protein/cobalt-zinc-cadmium efflux system membrane fusion protein